MLAVLDELRRNLMAMALLARMDPIQLWIPFPKQLACLKSLKKYVFMLGANRPGKTDWLVADACLWITSRHPYVKTPRNAMGYFSMLENNKLHQVILPKFRSKLGPQGRIWDYNETKKELTIIRGPGKGNKIFFLSQEAGRGGYASFAAHRFWIDEEHEEPIFLDIVARCTDHNAQILMAATPEYGLKWTWYNFWQPFRKGEMRDVLHIEEVTQFDNPTLDPKVILANYEVLKRADPLMARIKVYGEPINLSGTPFFNLEILNKLMKRAEAVFYEQGEFQEVA